MTLFSALNRVRQPVDPKLIIRTPPPDANQISFLIILVSFIRISYIFWFSLITFRCVALSEISAK